MQQLRLREESKMKKKKEKEGEKEEGGSPVSSFIILFLPLAAHFSCPG
jgi:hypothetical protein